MKILSCLLACFWIQISLAQHPLDKFMVPFADGTYIAPEEVSNIDYKEFLRAHPAQTNLRPDTSAWMRISAHTKPMMKSYFSHPAFNMYPVVNVSPQQAEAYCAWLTDMYLANPDRKHQKVVFRLPTEAEWEEAARAGTEVDYPWQSGSRKKYQQVSPDYKGGDFLANYYVVAQNQLFRADAGLEVNLQGSRNLPRPNLYIFTSPTRSMIPNGHGLYNMAGNVAEMVQEPGISKGGSWYHPAGHLQINDDIPYTEANPWLGFRYVMEVIKP